MLILVLFIIYFIGNIMVLRECRHIFKTRYIFMYVYILPIYFSLEHLNLLFNFSFLLTLNPFSLTAMAAIQI